MKDFFKELFAYNYQMNKNLITLLETNRNSFPQKSLELLNHVLNAQQIWNNRINSIENTISVWQTRPSKELMETNDSSYKTSLSILDNFSFSQSISYKNSKGETFSNSVQDVLFHVINHATYHRGQIAADMKAAGLTPLITDYIFYKR